MMDERMSWIEFRQRRMAEAGASQAYDAAKTDDGVLTVDVPCATCGKPVAITPTETVGSRQCDLCTNDREDWAAYAAAARSDADKVEQCGLEVSRDPAACHHCALHSLANAYEIAADIETERDRLAAELTRWESGQRRLAMPVVQSVPDGLRYAADLVRTAHEIDDYRLAELMRGAGMRLRALHNAAGQLLAEAVVMRAELEEVAGDG